MLLRQLEYLTALARERHFARAAAACFISQPALSAAIRKLESEFQVLIVQRGNRFLGFTPEGERIITWAYRILAERDALVEDVDSMRDGLSGTLRLGVIPTALSVLSLLTTPFCDQHPLARVSVISLSSIEIQRRLGEHELDVALTYIDSEPLAHVRTMPLYRERYVLLTDAGNPLADRQRVTWSEAARLPLCLLSPDMQHRRILNEVFRQVGAEPRPVIETNSVTAMYSHARHGAWSAIMPHPWLYLYGVPEGMRAVPLTEPRVTKGIGLVMPDGDPEPILARALLDVAREVDMRGALDPP